MRTIAIIGAGNMGGAIARGIVKSPLEKEYTVKVSNPTPMKLEALNQEVPAVLTYCDNKSCVSGADVVILAVKPWLVKDVIEEIKPVVDLDKTIIVSLAAGIAVSQLAEWLGISMESNIFRVMPNTAAAVGQSMTFIAGDDGDPFAVDELVKIFSAIGKAAYIPERQFGAAMALCSCGIAYVMRYIRASVEGAVQLGLYPNAAKEYMMQTMAGAVALLESTGNNPEVEIDKVTTPGGVTIKGLNSMEQAGFTNAVIQGLLASAK
ncbi:MAG: pyrroline-5-carboxylate reductase [Bacteroidales bacterium]|nr:pyrroline-5-carboxylate reductase [Bacteroidales bacterium]